LVFHNQLEQVVAIMRKMGALALLLLLIAVAAYFSYEIVKRRRISQGSTRSGLLRGPNFGRSVPPHPDPLNASRDSQEGDMAEGIVESERAYKT